LPSSYGLLALPPSEPAPAPPPPEAKRLGQIWRRALTRSIAAVLLGETVILLRLWAERNGPTWLPGFRQFQDDVSSLVGTFLPAIAAMPQDLVTHGFGSRISQVTGTFSVGYIAAIVVAAAFLHLIAALLVRIKQNEATVTTARGMDPIRRTAAICSGPVLVSLLAWIFLTDTGISRERVRYRRHNAIFWNFEADDIDLAYRASFAPVLVLLLVMFVTVGFLIIVLATIVQYGARNRKGRASTLPLA
jgi:hypothetical protein